MLILTRKHTPKTAITTSNKVKMTSPLSPDVPISHHFPKGKQTGPCTCSFLSPRGRGAPRACPRRWPRRGPLTARAHGAHPGGSAYLAALPSAAGGLRGAGGLGCGWARSLRGRQAAAAPLGGRPGSDHRPPARVGLRRQRPGLGALPRSQRVRFGFTTKSPRPRNPSAGSAAGGPGGAGAGPARRWRARARGGGPAAGRQLDAPVSQLGDVGAEEPVLPKTNGKGVTARAALRGRLSQCLGRKLLWLPEMRAGGGVAHVPSSVRPGLRFEGRPRLRVEGRPSRGPESAATPGQAPATRAFFPEPRPPAPLR